MVVVREAVASRTAVVRAPLDLPRILSLFDAVYAFLGSADVRQTGQNVALYRDKDVDDLLVAAQQATDEQTRSTLYAAVQDKIAVDAPCRSL